MPEIRQVLTNGSANGCNFVGLAAQYELIAFIEVAFYRLYIDGSVSAELPGTLYLERKEQLPEVSAGDCIQVKRFS